MARPEQEAKGVGSSHALRLLLRACHDLPKSNVNNHKAGHPDLPADFCASCMYCLKAVIW